MELTSAQRNKLRGLAHHMQPAVFVGKNGLTDTVITSINESLEAHELIKVKFVDLKDQKRDLYPEMARLSRADQVSLIGNIATLYRQHHDPKKRKIEI
jgi:RNA-binding protein